MAISRKVNIHLTVYTLPLLFVVHFLFVVYPGSPDGYILVHQFFDSFYHPGWSFLSILYAVFRLCTTWSGSCLHDEAFRVHVRRTIACIRLTTQTRNRPLYVASQVDHHVMNCRWYAILESTQDGYSSHLNSGKKTPSKRSFSLSFSLSTEIRKQTTSDAALAPGMLKQRWWVGWVQFTAY